MQDHNYVLRFLAGQDPGVEFPLSDYDREVVLGRADDADLILDDARVSRRHARIFDDGGRLLIEDLGSTNGIFVNAHRVQRSALKEGDRIQIGASLLKLTAARLEDPGRFDRTVVLLPGDTEAGSLAPKGDAANRFSGSIDEIPLFDLVQLLSTGKKSGALEVQSPQGQGQLYLRSGQIVYATIRSSPDLDPRKAVYRMLPWQSGTFELLPPDGRTFDRELTDHSEALVLEAMHQFDEIARFGKKLPPADLRLVVARPTPPLRLLNAVQLDLLKLIHAHPRAPISKILDLSPLPDLETYRALLHLGRNGYVQRGNPTPQGAQTEPGRP